MHQKYLIFFKFVPLKIYKDYKFSIFFCQITIKGNYVYIISFFKIWNYNYIIKNKELLKCI